MSQVLVLKTKGLHTAPNEFSSVPEGSLLQATNCSLDTDNILESRRGFLRYSAYSDSSYRTRKYAFYQNKVISAHSTNLIAYDNSGTWVNYSGTYADPDSNLGKIKFLLAQSNLYFTSDTGVYRLDAYNGTPVLSGVPKGLDLQLTLAGTGSVITTDNQVAYRVLWGFRDANNNIVYGAPSGRAVIVNPSAGSNTDITVRFTVPSGITTSYFYQVYRSSLSGGDDIEPTDELGLIYEANPSATDITNKYVEFTDSTPDSLRGATIYTAPSQQGILQSNERCPLAQDIALFQGSTFYANCKSKHRKIITLLSAAALSVNDTITIAGTVYTVKAAETITSGEFKKFTAGTVAQNIADTAASLVRVINRYTSNTLVYATIISGPNDLPGQILIEERGLGGSSFSITVSAAATAWSPAPPISKTFVDGDVTAGSDTIAIASHGFYTGQSVVPTSSGTLPAGLTSGTTYYVIYSTANAIKLASSAINAAAGTAVDITAAAGGGTHTITPTNVASSNDNYQHQVFYSKSDLAEAVPLLNYKFIGSANNAIRRIIPLGNSLFIFKEQEGIFRITGNSPSTFDAELFDSSARILAPESAAVVNNQIWVLTDQGIAIVSETGVSIISRPIEDKILGPTGTALTQVRYYSHGVGYETDRKYILWTVTSSEDTYATDAYVWNTFTRSFTRWDIAATTAGVNPYDGKLYIGGGGNQYTLQERKTLTYADYVDYSLTTSITAFSGTSITLNDVTSVEVGDVLYQSSSVSSLITAINGSVVTVADTLAGWSVASVDVLKSFTTTVEWAAIAGANPGTAKQFPEISILFRAARFSSATVSFATDASGSFEDVSFTGKRVGLWGLFPWGGSPWGGASVAVPIRVYVPLEKQRGSFLRVKFAIKQGYSNWRLNGLSVQFRETNSPKIAK